MVIAISHRSTIPDSSNLGPVQQTADYCRMFNSTRSQAKRQPKYISTDNDPLYQGQWIRNLCILEIEELKSIPGVPTSHPFVERMIGTLRRKCIDQMLFFNERDLRNKLDDFQEYFNSTRVHSSLNSKTPDETADFVYKTEIPLPKPSQTRWQKHSNGIFEFPVS